MYQFFPSSKCTVQNTLGLLHILQPTHFSESLFLYRCYRYTLDWLTFMWFQVSALCKWGLYTSGISHSIPEVSRTGYLLLLFFSIVPSSILCLLIYNKINSVPLWHLQFDQIYSTSFLFNLPPLLHVSTFRYNYISFQTPVFVILYISLCKPLIVQLKTAESSVNKILELACVPLLVRSDYFSTFCNIIFNIIKQIRAPNYILASPFRLI